MGIEIDLLKNYPKTIRDTVARNLEKNDLIVNIARQFGKDFFDGDRKYGYGGYSYHPRFWGKVVLDIAEYYEISNNSKILDVGCGKGFMLYDFKKHLEGLSVCGVDISDYAIANAIQEIADYLQVGNAISLPFLNNSFDLVISINTIHNLPREECMIALREIERVSCGKSFVVVDAYRNEEEKKKMEEWNLTAKTIMHVDEWKLFFKESGYTGDYSWFIP